MIFSARNCARSCAREEFTIFYSSSTNIKLIDNQFAAITTR